LTLLDLCRWQFAITVMFQMTFPAVTMERSSCVSYTGCTGGRGRPSISTPWDSRGPRCRST